MGTRSDIIVHRTDGKWARIYCHWDGYLSYNGRILFDHYKDQKKVEKLVELGDLSSLKENIGRKHSFDNVSKTMCTFYGRDRGEKDVDARVGNSIDEVWPESGSWTEFTYVWASAIFPGETEERFGWFVGDPDGRPAGLIPLKEALEADKRGGGGITSSSRPSRPPGVLSAGGSDD